MGSSAAMPGEGRAGIAVTPLIWSLQSGLPFAELDDIQQNLGIPMEKLVPRLGISGLVAPPEGGRPA